MSDKFINWVDQKGVPIMAFIVTVLLVVLAVAQFYFLIFGR
jgi:amino acid permease